MTFLNGLLLTVLSGALNGSFAVPIKLIKKWEWENVWLIYAFLGMLVFPFLVTIFYLPDILSIYATVAPSQLLIVFLFGCSWGVGSLLFGLGSQNDGTGIDQLFNLL